MSKRRQARERKDRNPVMKVIIQRAGSVSELAAALGISDSAVSQWREVPAERVLEIESITGVSRHIQRPDVFGTGDLEKKSHAVVAA